MNASYDYEVDYNEVTPDAPTSDGNNETIDNDEDKNYEEEAEKETVNENLNMKANDRETEETELNEEGALDPHKNDLNINDNSDNEKNYYEVTLDTPTNGINNETIYNYEDKNYEEESEKEILFLVPGGTHFHLEPSHTLHVRQGKD